MAKKFYTGFAVAFLAALVFAIACQPAALAQSGGDDPSTPSVTFTVNSTDDFPDLILNGVCATAFGTCTLRAAIEEVNHYAFNSGPHHINFNIAGAGPHTILIYSELPRLERAVIVDGTTEPGTVCPSSTTPATIKIVIDGSNVPTVFSDGLNLWRNASAPSGSTIKGVAIGGFGYGVWLDGDGHTVTCSHLGVGANGVTPLGNDEAGVMVWQGSNNTVGGSSYADRNVISGNLVGSVGVIVDNASNTDILGNYIGTDASGTQDLGNGTGVRVVDSASAVTIGGTGGAERNLISGNVYGITVDGDNVDIVNNLIGTNVSGTSAIANTSGGIEVWEHASGVTIGGGLVSQGNLISGNWDDGIYITEADGATILNNKIGVAYNGVDPLGNSDNGIYLDGNVINTLVGQPNDGNTIAYNTIGIRHYYCCGYLGTSTHGNTFRGNKIYNNDELGIDLTGNATGGVTLNDGAPDADTGPNDFQNYPGLVIARNNGYVLGLLATRPNITYDIDLYENDSCDDSGYGEGQRYLGTVPGTTDALGYYTIDTTLGSAPALGKVVVATATAGDGSTSEFSPCIPVTQETFVIDSTADTGDQTPGDGMCDVTGASTACTLRAAIQEVNALGGGPFGVNFDLGAGGGTVRPASPLPAITVPVVLDAVSAQDGAYCGSDSSPAANLNVILKGDLTTGVDGLTLAVGSDGSSIEGLVIRDFDGHGIQVSSDDNQITCNFVGLAADGNTAAPNGLDGVHVTGSNNRIGGESYALRNVISGNLGSGVGIAGATAAGNKIVGNIIGLRAGGGLEVPNGANGVDIDAAPDNVVGGNSSAKRNIISGNGQFGVSIHSGAADNAIRGNFIGTNEAGTVDRGNTSSGVKLDNVTGTLVGGINASYGNLISGNEGNGVLVQNGASGNNIRYNNIGLDVNGTILSNTGAGVRLNVSTDNWVGDNVIKFNGEAGVVVLPNGQQNCIRTNSIYKNAGLGIDLNNDGITPNDGPGDPDTGANGLQNFPIITGINTSTGTVDVTLESTASTQFEIDFFRSQQCDSSGYGEGQEFMATYSGSTNGAGVLNFTQALTGLNSGVYVTATATDASDNTSEFSPCVQVGCPDPDVDNDGDVDVADIIAVASRWNAPASYDTAYDLNCDGVIDMLDVMLVTATFGT